MSDVLKQEAHTEACWARVCTRRSRQLVLGGPGGIITEEVHEVWLEGWHSKYTGTFLIQHEQLCLLTLIMSPAEREAVIQSLS